MTWHGYFGIENLNMNDNQRAQLVAALRELGPDNDPQPARLNHWRTRLDGQAAIFEAAFDENNITIEAFKNRLGTIFSLPPETIMHSITRPTFDTLQSAVVTFTFGATDYLRAVFFGYDGLLWPTWQQSRAETVAYLLDNMNQWED